MSSWFLSYCWQRDFCPVLERTEIIGCFVCIYNFIIYSVYLILFITLVKILAWSSVGWIKRCGVSIQGSSCLKSYFLTILQIHLEPCSSFSSFFVSVWRHFALAYKLITVVIFNFVSLFFFITLTLYYIPMLHSNPLLIFWGL
jgi:hypothetical protein